MSRLSKISLGTISRRIIASVKDLVAVLMPAPASELIPIPVRTRRETQLTRRIR